MTRIIDQFGRKRCQKKRKDVDCKLLQEIFQKYVVVHEQSAVENSFITYVCYAPDGLFWLNLYLAHNHPHITIINPTNSLFYQFKKKSYYLCRHYTTSSSSVEWFKQRVLNHIPFTYDILEKSNAEISKVDVDRIYKMRKKQVIIFCSAFSYKSLLGSFSNENEKMKEDFHQKGLKRNSFKS